MESSESESAGGQAEQTAPLESPFKLIKVKGNKDGLSPLGTQPLSHATSGLSPNTGSPPALSPTSPSPATKLIALNPFSLSRFQKTAPPLNGPNITRISPSTVLTGANKDVSDQLITDLKNEIISLKKEIESKDAKLTSSMRSIKMFWSPELKKERAGRKEDVERMLLLKNQCDTLSAEMKKRSSRIKELQDELEIEREKTKKDAENEQLAPPDTEVIEQSNKVIEELEETNELLKKELCTAKDEYIEVKKHVDLKNVELSARDSLIKSMKTEIEDLKSKQDQQLQDQKESRNIDIEKLEDKLKGKEDEIEELCKRIKALEEEQSRSRETIEEKNLCLQKCEADMKEITKQIIALEAKCHQEEEERKTLVCQLQEKSQEIELLKLKASNLESEVKSGHEQKANLENTIEELKDGNDSLTKELELLREQFAGKDNELASLEKEVSDMKMVLDEKEKMMIEKHQLIDSMTASRRRESVESDDLKSVLDGKNREIESLNKKYETLDTYLSHRETALSHARDELSEIKSKHANCTSTTNFMESQITDKDQLIARLEKQRNRLEKEREDEITNANNYKEKIEVLNQQAKEKDNLIKDLEAKVDVLKSKLKDNKLAQTSESTIKSKDEKIKSLEEEFRKSQEIIQKLEKDLSEKKNKDEQDKNSIKVPDDAHKRLSGGPVKDSKMIKQLWDEISKKDSRLQDLEKQLKERGKQLTNLRKTQTAERGKQVQYLTDKSKLEDDSHNRYTDLQGELLKKDDRITMLEDALRESVSIAAEREELLAQHVELSEGASQTIHSLEADTDRLTMEKGITNIKNAFLILSLGERDAVVAALKSLRRRNIEELMNIKQTAMLSAISEKDANIALLELQPSSKGRKQEIKQLKQEKEKLVNELKEQTQQRITITNNEENKDGLLYKELEDAPAELLLQALRNLSDSSDKLEYYIDALLSFVKERNLEILKEVPSLQKRNPKGIDKLRNVGKSQLLRELQKLEEDCSQLKSFVDILLEKLECVRMPDVSDLYKKNPKSGTAKSSGSGRRRKPDDMDFSLNAALEALLLDRPSRPTPPNRPLPVVSDSLSEPRIKKPPSGYKNFAKTMEDTSSAGSSPAGKKHTPATIPRTKFTSATPMEQRIAMNKLKQKLDFTEKDEDSTIKQESTGRMVLNNEGAAAASAVLYDQASISSMAESIGTSQMESETSEMVDMSRILQRLNQVRDYLKQATSMYVSLSTKDQLEKSEVDHVDKLGKLIQQLRIQEQGYVDLLQRTLDMDQSANMTPASSVMSLKQSEIDDGEDSQQELSKLKMQHSLLKKIVDQQQQIQDLKKKQATLAALQEQAEEMMNSAEFKETEAPNMPNNLRLDRVQNIAATLQSVSSISPGKRITSQETEPPAEDVIDNEEAALLDADMMQKKLELENKLMSLQSKKEKMDSLLKTLKTSRDALSSAAAGGPPLMHQLQQTEQSAGIDASIIGALQVAMPRNNQAAVSQEALYKFEDVKEKLMKLKEVKQRLEDLGQIVSEYEHAQSGHLMLQPLTDGQDADKTLTNYQSGAHGGARPRNRSGLSEEFSDGLDNRMRPAPPGGRMQRPAIDVTRNQSSSKEPTIPQNIDAILASEKNLAAGSQDEDLTSKIRQLQEAKQRLATAQRTFKMPLQEARLPEIPDRSDATTASESETESESVSIAEDLAWQDDPEFQAKVRRLQHAKEKLKHLQDLVNSAQLDGISMDELANISLSSKASSEYDKDEKEEDEEEEEEEGTSDEEDEVTTEQDSQANIEDDDEDDDDDDDDDDDVSVDQTARQAEKNEESDGSNLDQAATLIDREIGYQLKLSQQKKELEKLLKEKQKLLEAQRQLSEIARGAFVSKEDEESVSEEKQETNRNKSPREAESTKKETEKRPAAKGEDASQKIRESPRAEKSALRVTYKDLNVPRIVKRTSNLSVEPQFGSDSDFRTRRSRAVAQANKRQSAKGRPSNPLVMSELRRQREMFEQNKKLKFVEKQRRKRDSADDRSDGGTYSIRSDIDEGVGVSMFSADVTTAATWGGSTEQSSTEEDSAVDEDDYPEAEAIEDEYEENIGQPEEEEEEIADEESEEDGVAPLFDLKKKPKKQKIEKPQPWFSVEDQREKQRGKKRKLDSRRPDANRGSTVSWSMNVSPESSRNRRRQQNLTPAHKLMRNRSSRPRDEPVSTNALEDQCEQLRQQLSNSTAFSTTLLRNQQTLLTMLQNQFATMNDARSSGFPSSVNAQQNSFGDPRGFQSPFGQSQPAQQRSTQMLQALNRCTSQLDRQCRDIQQLQREFQNMVVNPMNSGRERVYPWENPSPLNINTGYNPTVVNDLFKPSSAAQNDPFVSSGIFQQQYTDSPGLRYRPGLTHSATSPHAFLDDTQHRFTQTEIPADIPNTSGNNSYSLFSQQNIQTASQTEQKPTDYSPFRFYDIENAKREEGQEFFPISSAGYQIENSDINRSLNQESNDKYDPLVYTDASAVPIFSGGNRATGISTDVITTSYPTPSKSAATRNLADRQKATWPSFLNDADQLETASERTVSQYEDTAPRRGVNAELGNERKRLEKENINEDNMERMSVASNFSLFETMRDSIYSEVATLISMNESRPHYLVELFRELQLLTSDYLRQRALYSLQDLVTRFLTEDSEARQSNEPPEEQRALYSLQDLVTRFLTEDSEARQSNEPPEEVYQSWIGTAAAEQTPSESVATTDDDEQENKALEALSSQIRNNDMYDYAEIAETGSTTSTPTSSHDPPFAAEGLGDTVINLDEALQNMRSYEEKMAEARRNALEDDDQETPMHSLAYSAAAAAAVAASDSSAYDVNSEASSDIQQPSIDTQKLDRQIKAIMLELIPFLNEHMETQCTTSFLSELRNLILKLAKEKEPDAEKQEFGRSFHRQLESVLKDSLSKFEGRSLKECGEDILIDISEILFNELAFFRLMQDLDRPMSRQPGYYWRKDSDTDGYIAAVANENEEVTELSNGRDSAKSYDNGLSIGLLVNTTGTLFSPPAPKQAESMPKRSLFEVPLTVEDIEENGSDAEDETEASRQFVNVELSVSESRPVASTGSGEEDVEEDQQTFPEHHLAPESSVGAQQQADVAVSTDGSEGDDVDDIDEMPEDEEQRISPRAEDVEQDQNSSAEPAEDEREEDVRDEVAQREDEERAVVDLADDAARADVDRSNEDTEDNEITVDDLPTKLTGLTEADLQTRMESEQQAVEGAAGVLAHLGENGELAEDSNSIPQPDQQTDDASKE